jgi:hypothetical protein
MKKLIAILFFALTVAIVSPVAADVFDDNSERYYKQGTTDDGNVMFIDKNSIRHLALDFSVYVGILRLSKTSDLFSKAKAVIKPTEVPLYVVTSISVDCSKQAIKSKKIAILGLDITEKANTYKTLWIDEKVEVDWEIVPDGIEPVAKSLLCGPSF